MRICKIDGCNRKHRGKGLCNMHYLRWVRTGQIGGLDSMKKSHYGCKVIDCDNENYEKGYCQKHYNQLWRHGKILQRTTYDPNEIIEYDNYAEIILYNKKCKKVAIAIIDLEDVKRCRQYKWHLDGKGYVECEKAPGRFLHRFIINTPDDMITDHKFGNKLDNRKLQLRICTNQENIRNSQLAKNNTSGTTGVSWCNNLKKWYASIQINKKTKNLGSYRDKKNAISARKNAESKHFGEFAYQVIK